MSVEYSGNVKPKWYSSMHRPTLGRQRDFSDMVSPFFVPIPFNLIQYFIYLSNGPASCNASLPASCNASRKRANRSCMKSEHLFWGQLYLKDHVALVKYPYLSHHEEGKLTGSCSIMFVKKVIVGRPRATESPRVLLRDKPTFLLSRVQNSFPCSFLSL